jgi:EAL domain-containing protein (putative c-di-GMP-specific phosphodiesterase class I)
MADRAWQEFNREFIVSANAAVLASQCPTARAILDAGAVVTHFQPIYSAKQKSVVGVEALSRGINPVTAQLVSPVKLFEMANEEQLNVDMEDLCRDTALKTFAGLKNRAYSHGLDENAAAAAARENLLLFLNLDANAMPAVAPQPNIDGGSGLLFLNFDASVETDLEPAAAALVKKVRRVGLDPRSVAIEILESQFKDLDRLKHLAQSLHDCGFMLVLDDVGAGHSNLDRIPIIRPDVLKIDRSLISRIDTDYHKQETVKSLAHLARRIGALVVAEGVETEAETLTAMELGADLLQGFYLSRPQPPETLARTLDGSAVNMLAHRYKQHMVAKINQRKLQHRRYAVILNTLLCELGRADVNEFDNILHNLIRQHPTVECLYVLDESGHQVTESICSFDTTGEGHRLMFRPAAKGADHSLKEFYYVLLDVELQKYTTDPYVSLASGNLCRTISTCFRDSNNNKLYILCIDVTTG